MTKPRSSLLAVLTRLLSPARTSDPAWIEAEGLRQKLASAPKPTVIDVRGPDEFSGELGHIAGAVNLPLGEIDRRMDEVRARSSDGIVLVCRTDMRSAAARARLVAAGLEDVTVLRGGMQRWNALGFAVSRGS